MNDPDLVIVKVSVRPVEVVEEVKPVAVRLRVRRLKVQRLKVRLKPRAKLRAKLRPRLRPGPLRLRLKPKRNNLTQIKKTKLKIPIMEGGCSKM